MTSAAANLQADLASGSNYRSNQRCGYCSLHTSNNSCARIRRRSPLRSLQLATCRCRGHTWRIPDRCGRRKNLCRRYLSTQTSAACSCVPPAVRRTYCTRRSTTCRCYVAVLVLAICCQPTEHVVADPVVAISAAKTTLVLVPRTIEAGYVDVLLDQQRSAATYTQRTVTYSRPDVDKLHYRVVALECSKNDYIGYGPGEGSNLTTPPQV